MAKIIKKLHIDIQGIKDFNVCNTNCVEYINGKEYEIWKKTSRKSGAKDRVVYIQISENKFASAYHDPCGWHVETAENRLYTVVD